MSIKNLTEELNNTKSKSDAELVKIKNKLFAEYFKIFKDSSLLKKELSNAEGSSEYGSDDCGIYTWYRITYKVPKEEYALEAFQEYISENGFTYDSKNECVMLFQGECIIINEDNDTFLSDGSGCSKLIIDSKEHETEEERNVLIEAWMEKNGYFPTVLYQTRYGDLFLVNTAKKKI